MAETKYLVFSKLILCCCTVYCTVGLHTVYLFMLCLKTSFCCNSMTILQSRLKQSLLVMFLFRFLDQILQNVLQSSKSYNSFLKYWTYYTSVPQTFSCQGPPKSTWQLAGDPHLESIVPGTPTLNLLFQGPPEAHLWVKEMCKLLIKYHSMLSQWSHRLSQWFSTHFI